MYNKISNIENLITKQNKGINNLLENIGHSINTNNASDDTEKNTEQDCHYTETDETETEQNNSVTNNSYTNSATTATNNITTATNNIITATNNMTEYSNSVKYLSSVDQNSVYQPITLS